MQDDQKPFNLEKWVEPREKQPAQHTPLPWHYNAKLSKHHTQLVYGPDGRLVADAGRILQRSPEEQEANARFICRAVNSYAKLLSTLDFIASAQYFGSLEAALKEVQQAARAAIAKATEGL